MDTLIKAGRMETLDELRQDRWHVAHLIGECREGRHPATRESEADLQRELDELDAKIARATEEQV